MVGDRNEAAVLELGRNHQSARQQSRLQPTQIFCKLPQLEQDTTGTAAEDGMVANDARPSPPGISGQTWRGKRKRVITAVHCKLQARFC